MICEKCAQPNAKIYTYPGGAQTTLCDNHAANRGFCLNCGGFHLGEDNPPTPHGLCFDCAEEINEKATRFDENNFVYEGATQ
jgi:hypothetical protein